MLGGGFMSLKQKLVALFSVLMVTLLVIVSCTAYFYTEKTLRNQIEEGTVAVLDASVKDLDGWLNSKAVVLKTKHASIQEIASDGQITQAMVKGFKTADPDISDLYFGKAVDGTIVDGAGWIPAADFDSRTRSWYKDAIQTGKLHFGEPYQDGVTKKMALPISMPYKTGSGEVIGVLAEDILIDTLFKTVSNIKPYDGSFAVLLSRDGNVMAHQDETLLNKKVGDVDKLKSLNRALQGIKVENKKGNVTAYTLDGKEMLLVFTQIPSTQWTLGINIPVDVAYAPLVALRWIFIVGTILALFIVVIATWLIAKKITLPLEILRNDVNKLASGDFTQPVIANGNDEIAALANDVNKMRDGLRQLIHNIQEKSDTIAASSEELTANAGQTSQAANQVAISITNVAEGSTKQIKSVDDASRAVESMKENIDAIAENSTKVVKDSREAAQKADKGSQDVDTMITNMKQIESSVENLADVIVRLGKQSNNIGKITETISDIASQTNLLALNAAIEAARAGEQGKGFSVVAEEVRKLAEQSGQAAQQISEEINAIQQETAQAVTSMEDGNRNVKVGVESVNLVGANLKDIADIVQCSRDGVESIQNELSKIIEGNQKIVIEVKNINEISKISADESQMVSAAAEEQLAAMDEISSSSQSLAKMAQEMQEATAIFKI